MSESNFYPNITKYLSKIRTLTYTYAGDISDLNISWFKLDISDFYIPVGYFAMNSNDTISLKQNDIFGMASIRFVDKELYGNSDSNNLMMYIVNVCYFDGAFTPVILSKSFININSSIFKPINKYELSQ